MAKNKLEGLTKEQLQSKAEQLEHEIETLSHVIEASNTTVFDLLIGEVKKEMQDNIAEEEWKKLKENQKKIESYRSIEKTLQNQEDLLERKKEELEDVQSAIDCYQPTLFEQREQKQIIEIEGEAEDTGFEYEEQPIETGDVFKFKEPKAETTTYYLVKKSVEIANSFAFISNSFEGEKCLQYPLNLKLIEKAVFVGNIYDQENQEALEGLKIIADSQEKTEQEGTESESLDEDNTDS